MNIFPGKLFCPVKIFSSTCEGSYIEQTVEVCVMALLRYFQVTPHRGPSGDLPDPAGLLSLLLPSSAINIAEFKPELYKINPANIFYNTLALALAKFFPGEYFPLCGIPLADESPWQAGLTLLWEAFIIEDTLASGSSKRRMWV